MDADRELTYQAAKLKEKYPLAYADCFASALAMKLKATLVTGDPEFKKLQDVLSIDDLAHYGRIVAAPLPCAHVWGQVLHWRDILTFLTTGHVLTDQIFSVFTIILIISVCYAMTGPVDF